MPLKLFVGSAAKDFKGGSVSVNGEWKKIRQIFAWEAGETEGTWKQAFRDVEPLTVSVSPPDINWHVSGAKWVDFDTDFYAPYIATPTGGLGPYTYNWIAAGGANLKRNGSANTALSCRINRGQIFTGYAACFCYDSSGQAALAFGYYRFSVS